MVTLSQICSVLVHVKRSSKINRNCAKQGRLVGGPSSTISLNTGCQNPSLNLFTSYEGNNNLFVLYIDFNVGLHSSITYTATSMVASPWILLPLVLLIYIFQMFLDFIELDIINSTYIQCIFS